MQKIEIIMWFVALASLAGTVGNIFHKRWCFKVWLVCNSAWCFYDVCKEAYSQAGLMGIYAGLAVWGLIKWHQPEIALLGNKQRSDDGKAS